MTTKPTKYGKIRKLVQKLYDRQQADYDAVIVITGDEGEGKSTLAVDLARLMSKKNGYKFSYTDNIAYKAREAMDKIIGMKPKETILLDEGMRLAWRRQWYLAEQRHLVKLFSQIRSKNMFLILCIPGFEHLDSYYREHRVALWIHVVARGWAVLFRPDRTAGAKDRWGVDQAQKYFKKKQKQPVTFFDDVQTKIKKHMFFSSFWTYFKFPPMKDYASYKKIADARKLTLDEEDEVQKKPTRHSIMVYRAAKRMKENGKSVKYIADFFGAPERTVYDWLKAVDD